MTLRTIHLRSTDSTNSEARRLFLSGEAMPVLVRADTQTAGRGRNGRLWQSPAGGAWFSVAWTMQSNPATYVPTPIVAAAAVHEAISRLLPPNRHVEIKWPNDILINNRKVCGVLCETAFSGPRGAVIVGIGVNVNVDVPSLGTQLRYPATSLHEHTTTPPDVDRVIASIATCLERRLQSLDDRGLSDDVIRYVDAHLAGRGRSITWSSVVAEPSTVARKTGILRGLDERGVIVLDTDTEQLTLDHGELLAESPAEMT